MSEIFSLTNLLLLAVALIVFLRLRSVLGKRTGAERPPRLDPYIAGDTGPKPRDRDNVVTLPRAAERTANQNPPLTNLDDRLSGLAEDGKARDALREIAAADPTFETTSFIKGAKVAYESIVTAYAKGDRDTLHNLLSPDVYDSFNSVISQRENHGETTEFSFVGISAADIVDGHLSGRMAHVTVRFASELVTAVRDRSGQVIEGDLKTGRRVTDIWTFMRDVTSSNPNWRVVATDAP